MRATKAVLYRIAALLVLSPQPTLNASPTLNTDQLFLHKVIEDEVAGQAFLLLNIKKNKR